MDNNSTDIHEYLDSNPWKAFEQWYVEALKLESDNPNWVVLATADLSGQASARVVLLKEHSQDKGLVFFTNYSSRKSQELLANPQASLLFYWDKFFRQVRVEGRVNKISVEESEKYFHSRPKVSQIGAWASKQSRFLASREELDARFHKYEEKFSTTEVPLPEFWGGFSLVPRKFEFWQGEPARLHQRLVYEQNEQEAAGWSKSLLYP